MKPKFLALQSKFLLPFCVAVTFSGAAIAAPITWSGAEDFDFSWGPNWVGDVAPANDLTTDIATFSGALTAEQPDVFAGDYSVNGLDFASSGWTLSGANSLSIGTGGITSAGDNTVSALLNVANADAKPISATNGSTLTLGKISANDANRGNITFGTASNDGTVILEGDSDNPYLTPTVAFGTVVLSKGTPGGTIDSGSAVFNVTVDPGATLEFGPNLTDRGNYGQIAGTATVNGTLDMKADGTEADNWNMGALSGSGVVTNTGTGNARVGVRNGNFTGQINNGDHVTSLLVNNSGSGRFELTGTTNYAGDFSGNIIVNAGGNLWVKNNGALGDAANTITLDNGNLQNNSSNTDVLNTHEIILGAGGGQFQAGWGAGRRLSIQGLVSGVGQLTIAADSGKVYMDGTANTYEGGTVIKGYLQTKVNESFGLSTSPITFDGGTLKNNDSSIDWGTRDISIEAGGATIICGWGNSNRRIVSSGIVQGLGQLTVGDDSGALWLIGTSNTYAGGTVIEGAGKIQAVADASLGSDLFLGITLDGGTLTNLDSNLDVAATRGITLTENGGTLTAGWAKRVGVAGVITGPGQLTIGVDNGDVYLDNAGNDYAGGTVVKANVRPKGDDTLGDASGTVTMDGGTFQPNGSFTYPATRTFLMEANGGTFIPNGMTAIDGVIEDAAAAIQGPLLVSGASGTLVLNGTNTYTGDTIVTGDVGANPGAILAVDGDSIPDAGTLVIQNDLGVTYSGQVEVTGTEVVASLVLDGVTQAAGMTYGSTSSTADVQNDTYFSTLGTGVIEVAAGGGFSSWITGTFTNGTVDPGEQGTNDDPDNDGIANLVEYAIDGQDPTVSNTNIGTFAGDLLSFTKSASATGLTYAIQESTDLGISDDWTEVTGGGYVNDATTISYQLTPGSPVENFTRLQVIEN